MKLNELIDMLQTERSIYGDIEVAVQGLWINKDGEVRKGLPVMLPPYQLMEGKSDAIMTFERVVYE